MKNSSVTWMWIEKTKKHAGFYMACFGSCSASGRTKEDALVSLSEMIDEKDLVQEVLHGLVKQRSVSSWKDRLS